MTGSPKISLPDAPPRPWRPVARLLVVDPAERMLLLRTHDPSEPATRQWWEVPGGGIEPGEDSVAAAVRELAEETGYVIDRDAVGPVCWSGDTTYRWMGVRDWSSIVVHLARVDHLEASRAPDLQESEQGAFLDVRWVSAGEVGDMQTFPAGLATLLPRMLVGERIDVPFRAWN